MAISANFFEFTREVFAQLGPLEIKRMFGGAGIYQGGRMFALIDDDVIYLKVDEAMKEDLRARGVGPFIFTPKSGEPAEMPYWRLPESALDDSDEAAEWGRRAIAVAQAAAAKKKPKKKPGK